MKKLLMWVGFPLAAACLGAAPEEGLKDRAARLQKSAIVLDTHEDVPERLEREWVDIGVRNRTGQVDIPRLQEGGVTAAFFAAYVPAAFAEAGGSTRKALELIDLVHRLADEKEGLVFADSVEGVRAAKRNGKIAALIGIEGGHAIENSLGALSAFYRLGVRYMTLTHTNTNAWADSSGSMFRYDFDPKKYAVHGGLTDFGRDVVREMNRLGMLVDVSHVSDDTIRDVLEVSKAPVFASHSSCRALAGVPRNLTDDQIRGIAAKGGVVMVNFHSVFLGQRVVDAYWRERAALAPGIAELEQAFRDDPKARESAIDGLMASIRTPRAASSAVADHIERILLVGGAKAAGLGTDYDGDIDPPTGLEDVSRLTLVTEELLRRGHSEQVVRGVLGENFLAFW
ncbi:MAG: dipeptidase, partial [Thermoanaerobaculia bacterium]